MEINKIYNCDCLEIMKQFPDNYFDLCLTDPPYGINYKSNHTKHPKKRILNDGFEEWIILMRAWLPELKRVLKDDAVCCCCCGGGGKTPVTAIMVLEVIKHFHFIQTLVWKKFIGLGWRYRPSYENIIIFSKSKDNYKFYDESKACSNVIEGINQEIPQKDEHPTKKQVALMIKLLEIHSKEGNLVLDPFAGSCSTAVACKRMGRKFIMIEKDAKYCEIGRRRLKQEKSMFDKL